MTEWKDMYSSSPARAPKSQLKNPQQEDAGTHQRKVPHVQDKGGVATGGSGCIIMIKSNLIPTRNSWRHKNKNKKKLVPIRTYKKGVMTPRRE